MSDLLGSISSSTAASASNNPSVSQTAKTALTTTPAAGVLAELPVNTTGSVLLGNGSGAASVLEAYDSDSQDSLFGSLASTTSELMTQVQATENTRLEQSLDSIDSVATAANSAIQTQVNRWISVKAQINNAQIAVTSGQDSVQKVSNTLLDLRETIADAAKAVDSQDSKDLQYWVQQFDTQVNNINIQANLGGTNSNLVGSQSSTDFSPNTITYMNNITGTQTTLNGTNIGTNFQIIGNDGTVWVDTPASSTLTAYHGPGGAAETYTDGAGQKLAKATSTTDGLKLVSYDPKSQQITVNVTIVPTDPPIQVTGTLQTSGIGIMGSWFYNDFQTTADQKSGFDAINTATNNLVSASATLTSAQAQTTQDQNHANTALAQLNAQTATVDQTQQTQTQAAQVKAAQQYLAMQANLQNATQEQNNYLNAFANFTSGDPFASVSLDMSV